MKSLLDKIKRLNNSKVILGFFVVTAFVLRLLPWNSIIVNGGKTVIFIQPDAYYQMRRAMIWAMNFPKLITMDYYMAYPFGAECPWPPLYNFTIAVLTLIFSGGKPNQQVLQLVTAFLPPLIAAMCIIPVYKIVKLVWKNERIALFSAFFAIIMPGMLGYSTIGSGDHHVAETFLFLCFFYFGLNLLNLILSGRKNLLREIFIVGIMIALGILIWQGQVVFFTIWCIYLALVILLNRNDRNFTKSVALSFLFSGLIGAAVAAFVRFLIPRSTEQTLFDFGFFSYFQPIYVFFIFFAVYVLCLTINKLQEDSKNYWKIVTGIVIVAGVILVIPPLRKGVFDGVNFLLKSDPWHSSINEFQTTFSWKKFAATYNTKEGMIDIIYFFSFLFPLCFGFLYLYRGLKWKKSRIYFVFYHTKLIKPPVNGIKLISPFYKTDVLKKENDSRILVLFYGISGVMLGLMAFYQKRWGNAFSPVLAIGIALFANAVYLKIKAGHGFFREFLQWRREKKRLKPGIITRFIVYWEKSPFFLSLFCVFFVMVPYFYIAESMINTQGYPIQSDLYNSLVWIKNYTPKTSHLWQPDKKPEYAILAPWDHGHYIQYISERPTIVNNFGHQLRGDGFKISNYIWSCETEEELIDIVNRYGIRFIFLNDPINYLNKKYSVYFKPGFIEKYIVFKDFHFGELVPMPNDLFFTLPIPRMWAFDGSSTSFGPALKHFRLVFESQNPQPLQYFDDSEIKIYKMYEYVKGVKIVGKAAPRSIVFITAHFISNFDREFDWNAAAIADENGNFKGTLPYATSEDNIFVKPLSHYIIYADGKAVEVNISNEDVLNGKTINVDVTKGKTAPKEFQENVRNILKSIAGHAKTPSFINIHKKPTQGQ